MVKQAKVFWLNTDMMLLANQAVRMVAEALHSSDYPWDVASEIKMPVVSGAKYYYLTEDALSIESVAHFSAGIQNQPHTNKQSEKFTPKIANTILPIPTIATIKLWVGACLCCKGCSHEWKLKSAC